MNISEQILKNAVMLGGESLYFFKQNIKLRDISSESITITLDGFPVQKVPENKYLFVDGDGVTYGVIEYFFEEGQTPPTDIPDITKELKSKNAFPLLHIDDVDDDNKLVSSPLYIEVAAEKVSEPDTGIIKNAPGWMNKDSYKILTLLDKPASETEPKYTSVADYDPKFAAELQGDVTVCRFSVAKKDTVFHDELFENVVNKEFRDDRVDADKFTKKNGLIDQLTDSIDSATMELRTILKFQIGDYQYEKNISVINNAFNGVYAWLLERASGDLAHQKLDHDHYYDKVDMAKDYVSATLVTLGTINSLVAVFLSPTPDRDELIDEIKGRNIDISYIVNRIED